MNAVMTAHRQFGSKARVAERLLALVPDDVEIWGEAFAGTAAMTLAGQRRKVEHINDLNGWIVNLFRVVRDPASLAALLEALDWTPYAEAEFEACMTSLLASQAPDEPDVEAARRFLVMSWQGIGGKQGERSGWRFQRDAGTLPGLWARRVPERLRLIGDRLRETHIHRRHAADFVKTFADLDRAFLFVDPPYPRGSIITTVKMYAVDMSDAEHRLLGETLKSCRCRIMLTMAPGTVYSKILGDWTAVEYPVRGMRNSVKTEIALMNYRPRDGLFDWGAA